MIARRKAKLLAFLAVVLGVVLAVSAWAQPQFRPRPDGGGAPGARFGQPRPQQAPARGEDLVVSVVTFGPGDHPFFKFGHNAIWIHNKKWRTDGIYNFGTFSFGDPSLMYKFVQGRFEYWLSRSNSISGTVKAYARENRTVEIQELNLTPDKRLALYNALEENLKPENKKYKYHYFADNCSTRVRDHIDAAVDGKLREVSSGPASMTYREHTLRLVHDVTWEYIALDMVMGDYIDQPITQWQEAFLPRYLQERLREVKVLDENGNEVPLVKEERTLNAADRPKELDAPPSRGIYFLGAGIFGGGALLGMGRGARKSKALRVLFGVLLALLGLLFGFLGTFYLGAWLFTDHEVGYHNENILHHAPFLFALVVLGVGVSLGRPRATRRAYKLVALAAIVSLLGVVLKILPWFDQQNWRVIAFAVPLWLGTAAGLYFLHLAVAATPSKDAAPKTKKSRTAPGEHKASAKEPAVSVEAVSVEAVSVEAVSVEGDPEPASDVEPADAAKEGAPKAAVVKRRRTVRSETMRETPGAKRVSATNESKSDDDK